MAVITGARAQLSFEAVTTPGEIGTSPHAVPVIGDLETDRRRSKAANAAQVTIYRYLPRPFLFAQRFRTERLLHLSDPLRRAPCFLRYAARLGATDFSENVA